MRKHRLGKQLLIVLCVICIVFLAGCRPSPVLEQIIYEQNHEIDEDIETQAIDNDSENEEPDEDIPPRETAEDAEQITDEERTSALAGDTDSEDPDAVYDVAYDVYGDLSEPDAANPTDGSASEKAVGSGGTGTEEGSNADVSAGQEAGTEDVSGGEPEGGGNADTDDGSASGTDYQPTNEPTGEPRQVVDAAGRYVEVPQNVDSVTAVGEIATMVEMLGGSGRLVGSSSSFTGSSRVQTTFDLTGVNTWWDGDGSSPCGSFDALLNAHPDVCFEIDNQETFSSAQITALEEAGIAYVVLPKLNSLENIEYAVTIVGEVLGDRAADLGINANSLASDYCDWAESVIRQVSNAGGSNKYTVYISKWDTEATWYISNGTGPVWQGSGAPVSMKKEKSAPLNECMTLAHLTNRGWDNQYVEPLWGIQYFPSISSGSGLYSYDGNLTAINYSYRLGNSNGNYPAVIVADSQIADYLMDRTVDSYGYWHWRVGESRRVGNTYAYGFYDDGRDGKVVTSFIEGDYWIYVNPSGVGSWADGSVESPLEAAWLSCKFQGGISESDLQGMVSEFYSKFYPAGASLPNISEDYYITR